MNVLIINSNTNVLPMAVMPLGACMVAEAAARAGHNVRFLDLTFQKDPLAALGRELARSKPPVVGISARNIDNNDMQNPLAFIEALAPMVQLIRRETAATVVLGGAGVGIMPEAFLRASGADYVVPGNGEFVFPRLLAALERNEDVSALPGVARLDAGQYRCKGLDRSESCETCFVPDFERWIPAPTYTDRFSTVPIQTKRGCPFGCVYCTYNTSEGSTYRLCSPESVVAGVRFLTQRGMRDIEFVDNVFNAPRDHALAVCEGLAAAKTGARLSCLELNPAYVDDALFSTMEDAGFIGVGITAESISDPVLQGLGKNYASTDIFRSAELVSRHALPCLWIFMLGGPGETEGTVEETLRFARQHIRSCDVAFFGLGIRIYPGTKLERIARDQGVLKLPPLEMLKPVFYLSPALENAWLVQRVKREVRERENFIGPDALGLPYLSLLYRAGRLLGLTPPIWKHVRLLKRGQRFLGAGV